MPSLSKKSSGIVSWPEGERPRERLLQRGPQALTDAELVAILVRVGFKGTNAVELGRQLLKKFGSLRGMISAPLLALLEIKGLKGAKASQLLAAMEIARRTAIPDKRSEFHLTKTAVVAEYLQERLRALPEEHFRVLYLNRRNALLEDVLITQGEVDFVRPSLRKILAHALQVNASSLIAAHNHPSGVAKPSESDRLFTLDLIAATRPLGLKLFDHFIIGEEATYSFADSGLLNELELECLAPTDTRQMRKLAKKETT